MLDSRVTGELLAEARRAGAKVVLAGDDRQLASIERGGLFAELRAAARGGRDHRGDAAKGGLAAAGGARPGRGPVRRAVQAFDRHGAITWTADEDAARAALVERWKADTLADPKASRFVFAYTNADVGEINAELRQVRRDRGELGGPDVRLATKHGERTSRWATGCSSPTPPRSSASTTAMPG